MVSTNAFLVSLRGYWYWYWYWYWCRFSQSRTSFEAGGRYITAAPTGGRLTTVLPPPWLFSFLLALVLLLRGSYVGYGRSYRQVEKKRPSRERITVVLGFGLSGCSRLLRTSGSLHSTNTTILSYTSAPILSLG